MDNPPALPSHALEETPLPPSPEEIRKRRLITIGAIVGILLVLACVISALTYLLWPSTDAVYVARIRDVFIIVMAFESLLIGAVLVILIVQLARLINLLDNEIKPILASTNETVSTLRGTTKFLSDNLAEPVIKLNEYLASLRKALELLGLGRTK